MIISDDEKQGHNGHWNARSFLSWHKVTPKKGALENPQHCRVKTLVNQSDEENN
jgi:hypothetical protein